MRNPQVVVTDDSSPPSDDLSTIPSQSSDVALDQQQIAKNVQALKNRLRGRGGRRGGKEGWRSDAGSGRDSVPNSEYVRPYLLCSVVLTLWLSSETPTKKKTKTKTQRKWGIEAPTETDMASLDYSVDKPDDDASRGSHDLNALVDKASLGVRTQDGMYEVKDWEFSRSGDDETDNVIAKALNKSNLGNKVASTSGSSLGAIGSLFARLTGAKVLTEEDLKPVLEGMKQHLMKKNVAKEIADKVCEGVGETLVGKKVGSFQSTFYSFMGANH